MYYDIVRVWHLCLLSQRVVCLHLCDLTLGWQRGAGTGSEDRGSRGFAEVFLSRLSEATTPGGPEAGCCGSAIKGELHGAVSRSNSWNASPSASARCPSMVSMSYVRAAREFCMWGCEDGPPSATSRSLWLAYWGKHTEHTLTLRFKYTCTRSTHQTVAFPSETILT